MANTIQSDDLLKHEPRHHTDGKLIGCECGWQVDPYGRRSWWQYVEHLPALDGSGVLVLSGADVELLSAIWNYSDKEAN